MASMNNAEPLSYVWLLPLLLVGVVLGIGCTTRTGQSIIIRADRDPVEAEARMREGVRLMSQQRYADASEAFEAAVAADAFSGLARNNLGVALFKQGELHAAAVQFDNAIRLLPDRHEPHHNLALVLEAAGRYDESIQRMETALSLAPRNVEIIGGLARIKHRRGDRDTELWELLSRLRLSDVRSPWFVWARTQLAVFETRQQPAADTQPPNE